MTGGSLGLGIRSGSYGSLEKHFQQQQNGAGAGGVILPIQSTTRPKPAKMLKDKERLFHWFCKFVGRKKVGMLFLCIISAAVFIWVLYVGKGLTSDSPIHVLLVIILVHNGQVHFLRIELD